MLSAQLQRMSYFNVSHGTLEDTLVIGMVGSRSAALETFKNDLGSNGASMLKLRERTREEAMGLPYNMFDRYEEYEDWYIELDRHDNLSVPKYAATLMGNDPADFKCHTAFAGYVGRMLWYAIMSNFGFTPFLAFQYPIPPRMTFSGIWIIFVRVRSSESRPLETALILASNRLAI
jgi:hypothetical protein